MNGAQLASALLVLFWASFHVETANRAWRAGLTGPEPLSVSFEAFWGAMRHG